MKEMDCDKFISAFDSYNLCLTGDVGRTLSTPSGGLNEHIPLIVLNDMGGSVMNVSDIPGTLRAQDHGHPPVVCFAECNSHLYVSKNSSQTIRAESHGALPVVCFEPGIMSRDCSA